MALVAREVRLFRDRTGAQVWKKGKNQCGTHDPTLSGSAAQRFYHDRSERVRAALAWTEAVIRIHGDIGDELFEPLRVHFRDKEIVDLTLVVVAINSWNRLAIGFRTPLGSYRP